MSTPSNIEPLAITSVATPASIPDLSSSKKRKSVSIHSGASQHNNPANKPSHVYLLMHLVSGPPQKPYNKTMAVYCSIDDANAAARGHFAQMAPVDISDWDGIAKPEEQRLEGGDYSSLSTEDEDSEDGKTTLGGYMVRVRTDGGIRFGCVSEEGEVFVIWVERHVLL